MNKKVVPTPISGQTKISKEATKKREETSNKI